MSKQSTVPDRFAPRWLDSLDGRTAVAQDLRARYEEMTNDLGGAANLSYAQRSLVERALHLEFWLRNQEVELASGKDFDVSRWVQAANSLQGVFAKLGLERKAREVPDLQAFIQRREARQ